MICDVLVLQDIEVQARKASCDWLQKSIWEPFSAYMPIASKENLAARRCCFDYLFSQIFKQTHHTIACDGRNSFAPTNVAYIQIDSDWFINQSERMEYIQVVKHAVYDPHPPHPRVGLTAPSM